MADQRRLVSAAELDAMTPDERNAAVDERIVTTFDEVPWKFRDRVIAMAERLAAERRSPQASPGTQTPTHGLVSPPLLARRPQPTHTRVRRAQIPSTCMNSIRLTTIAETAARCVGELVPQPDEVVLIFGAAGGVGMLATQLVMARGAAVIGVVTSAEHGEAIERFGATAVSAGPDLVERLRVSGIDGVDAVLDTSGAGVLEVAVTLAGGPERVVTIADMGAASLGVRFSGGDAVRAYDQIPEVAAGVAAGSLWIPAPNVRDLADVVSVHEDIEARRLSGKVVLVATERSFSA